MASTATDIRAGELKFVYGQPEVIALKFTEPRMFSGSFGDRALFTLSDERKLWVDAEDASEIVRDMREHGITQGEPFRMTKIRHPRGGGHSFRVEPLHAAKPAAPAAGSEGALADKLEQSVAIARRDPRAFQHNAHVIPPAPPEAPAAAAAAGPDDTARRLMSCFAASIEAITDAQAFADRKGLKVTFTSEDVRATAISAYIQLERAALTVRY